MRDEPFTVATQWHGRSSYLQVEVGEHFWASLWEHGKSHLLYVHAKRLKNHRRTLSERQEQPLSTSANI